MDISILALLFVAAALLVVVERVCRARRRAACRSHRVWFEYAQMAARQTEELRGR